MGAHPSRSVEDWASIITDAYAAKTRPPLTSRLVGEVRGVLAEALAEAEATGVPWPERCERVNLLLDRCEMSLHAAVGPRLAGVDEAAGTALMAHRSEAGRPLRAYGGQ